MAKTSLKKAKSAKAKPSAEKATVAEYIASLPPERRADVSKVRKVIRENLPSGIEETYGWGMIVYQVPLKTFSETYNGRPLMYAALGSQKNHMAVYLVCLYSDAKETADFAKAYKATGKKLDMGKACVRFKSIEDLPLALIGKTIAAGSKKKLIAAHNRHFGAKKSAKTGAR